MMYAFLSDPDAEAGLVVAIILVLLLALRELTTAVNTEKKLRLLDAIIVPLMITFILIVVFRVLFELIA